MIGALTAPDLADRLGLSDTFAAARHEHDARPSTCTSHAHACYGTIAHYRCWHSVACTECHRRESCMAWWHAMPYGDVRGPRYAVVSIGAVSADMCQGRYPGEMVASAPVGDAEVIPGLGSVPLAWPVAERHSGAVSGRCRHREKARDGINLWLR